MRSWLYTEFAICEATARRHTSSYSACSFSSSPGARVRSSCGVTLKSTGRMASCASCAFFFLVVYLRAIAGSVSRPAP